MGGERTQSGTGDARAIPQGEEEFVVVDDDELNLQNSGAEPGQDEDSAPFSPGAFPALGASLSAGVAFAPPSSTTQQSQNPRTPHTESAAAAAAAAAAPDATAAGAVVAALDLVYKALCAYAVAGYRFLHAHGAVAYNFVYTHAAVAFEFVYAYAVVALHETLGLLEAACSWVRSAWQRWQERGPASVKRMAKKRFLPVLVAVALSLLLVLPAYWAIPRGGGGGNDDGSERLSARQWQAKYDLLSSKFSADTVRQRLKYDSLAGRHLELQAEYESLLKDYKIQQRANRARSLPKTPEETCSKSESVLGPAKEALKLAEQSAYEYLSHFAEGLREDVHEIAERYFGMMIKEVGGGERSSGGSSNNRCDDKPGGVIKESGGVGGGERSTGGSSDKHDGGMKEERGGGDDKRSLPAALREPYAERLDGGKDGGGVGGVEGSSDGSSSNRSDKHDGMMEERGGDGIRSPRAAVREQLTKRRVALVKQQAREQLAAFFEYVADKHDRGMKEKSGGDDDKGSLRAASREPYAERLDGGKEDGGVGGGENSSGGGSGKHDHGVTEERGGGGDNKGLRTTSFEQYAERLDGPKEGGGVGGGERSSGGSSKNRSDKHGGMTEGRLRAASRDQANEQREAVVNQQAREQQAAFLGRATDQQDRGTKEKRGGGDVKRNLRDATREHIAERRAALLEQATEQQDGGIRARDEDGMPRQFQEQRKTTEEPWTDIQPYAQQQERRMFEAEAELFNGRYDRSGLGYIVPKVNPRRAWMRYSGKVIRTGTAVRLGRTEELEPSLGQKTKEALTPLSTRNLEQEETPSLEKSDRSGEVKSEDDDPEGSELVNTVRQTVGDAEAAGLDDKLDDDRTVVAKLKSRGNEGTESEEPGSIHGRSSGFELSREDHKPKNTKPGSSKKDCKKKDMSRDKPKDKPKDKSEDKPKDKSKDKPKDKSKDSSKDKSKDKSKYKSKYKSKDKSKAKKKK